MDEIFDLLESVSEGFPTYSWTVVGQVPTVLTVDAGGVVWTFSLDYHLSFLSPSLCDTARYRMKYCLKGSSDYNIQPKGSRRLFKCFRSVYHVRMAIVRMTILEIFLTFSKVVTGGDVTLRAITRIFILGNLYSAGT